MVKAKVVAGISLIIFLVVFSSLVMADFWNERFPSGRDSVQNQNFSDQNETVLTDEEVAKHATPNDCWIVIDGLVYDVSRFISQHPGGAEVMLSYCGKDGTAGFLTKDQNPGKTHSQNADEMLTAYLVGKLGESKATVGISAVLSPTPTPVTPPTPVSQKVSLTVAEVAKHNLAGDCWLIISGSVYNLTAYIKSHPGGSGTITGNCGRDATNAFATQGGKGTHSNFANSLLGNYLIGSVNSSVNVSTVVSNPTDNTAGVNPGSFSPVPIAISALYPTAVVIKGKYEDEGKWEGKVDVSGVCRAIKVSDDGKIIKDERC